MRQTTDDRHGARLRALIVVLWRGGLRVQEALAHRPAKRKLTHGRLRRPTLVQSRRLPGAGPDARSSWNAHLSLLPRAHG